MWFSHLSAERATERMRASGRRESWYAFQVGVTVGTDGSEEVCGDCQLMGELFRLGMYRSSGDCTLTSGEFLDQRSRVTLLSVSAIFDYLTGT